MDELKLQQEKLLSMMKFFHQYCEEKKLTYIAVDGTMLGAIRHKGFIPWDDDIDLGMPRKDFQRLMRDAGVVGGKYYLEGPDSADERYCYPYAKFYDMETTMIENTRQKPIRGIFIDIFPLDGLTDEEDKIDSSYREVQKYKNYLLLRTMNIRKDRKWYKNLLIRLFRLIPFKSFNEKILCHSIDTLCRKKDFDETRYGGNLLGFWGTREVMDRDIIGTPVLYDFEDTKIYGAEKYDAYLTKLYGDWRQLPPEEKRVAHHDYYLNLSMPYKEYETSK